MKPFLTAGWYHLAMFNYRIDPKLVEPLVPNGCEIDYFEGETYVSVVGFMFDDTRLRGWPIPFHRSFEEINLRFYVRRKGDEGWRRGVSFIKELVKKRAVAFVARKLYNENYQRVPMKHRRISPTESRSGLVEYSWFHANRWNRMAVTYTGDPEPLRSGSEEEFIAEHYWGYACQLDRTCMEYRVEHPPWRVWGVQSSEFDAEVTELYGRDFAEVLKQAPSSVFLAEGSPVAVYPGVKLPLSRSASLAHSQVVAQ